MESMLGMESLGERIAKAARMAVAVHLYSMVSSEDQREGILHRRVGIGSTGPFVLSDADCRAFVTDDERQAGTGRAE